jgi:DNA-binding NarL/FixJ family response regulator
MIRVLLVDDHAVVRTGFRLLLQSLAEISVIAEAESGEAACQRFFELEPDVVVPRVLARAVPVARAPQQ